MTIKEYGNPFSEDCIGTVVVLHNRNLKTAKSAENLSKIEEVWGEGGSLRNVRKREVCGEDSVDFKDYIKDEQSFHLQHRNQPRKGTTTISLLKE